MADNDQLKIAFYKVKQDITYLSEELNILKDKLKEQKNEIKDLINEIKSLNTTILDLKNNISTGNNGVNQSINHLINQSIINQSDNHLNMPEMPINTDKPQNKGREEANQSFNQSINQQSTNHLINQIQERQLKGVTEEINKVFSSLSKQELKLFLTIYQLEDDGIGVSYKAISLKMQLSEHCIRSHLSSLLRKNTPIVKKRMNNHTNLLSISKEFRALNLKQRLINLYYESDPHQKTLFDIN